MDRAAAVCLLLALEFGARARQACALQRDGSNAPAIEAFDAGIVRLARELEPTSGRIAILDFPDLNEQATDLGKLIGQSLTTAIVSRKPSGVQVFERLQVDQILTELRFRKATDSDLEYLRIGKAIGADFVMFGTAQAIGQQVVVNARLVDVGSRAIIAASHVSVYPPGVATAVTDARSEVLPPTDPATTSLSPVLHSRGAGWDVSVSNCKREGALVRCEFGFSNTGQDETLRLHTCEGNVEPSYIIYCSRGYFPGSVILPFAFDRADANRLDGEARGFERFAILMGRAVSVRLRLENPPPRVAMFKELNIEFEWGRATAHAKFQDVPIVAALNANSAAVASRGFEFSAPTCHRGSPATQVVCEVTIVNHGTESALEIQASPYEKAPLKGTQRALDQRGDGYLVKGFKFLTASARSQQDYAQMQIPGSDSVHLQFRVLDVPAASNVLNAIELHAESWRGNIDIVLTPTPVR